MVICLGTVMYMVEGGEPDTSFTDIPTSIYWAIVTMTTVGYGDITPVTPLGRFFAGLVMLLGYTIIAVPTGIVSSEMVKQSQRDVAKKYEKDRLNGEN
jgi:voltage-gated potassium channel